jgi:hypothetical protein
VCLRKINNIKKQQNSNNNNNNNFAGTWCGNKERNARAVTKLNMVMAYTLMTLGLWRQSLARISEK